MAKTMLPIALTKKAAGHRIIAMVKNTGSPILNQALIALCAMTLATKAPAETLIVKGSRG